MNRVHIIERNPAYVKLEPDGGNDPVTLAPNSDDEEGGEVLTSRAEEEQKDFVEMNDLLGELVEKLLAFNSTMQGSINHRQPLAVNDINKWEELKDRLYNLIGNMLQIMQERVDHDTGNDIDIKIIEGLQVIIAILQDRLNVLTDLAIRHRARIP